MVYKYYLDESGNTGDLIGNKFDLSFGNQPIFTLACIGISNEQHFSEKIDRLKIKHNIKSEELKSSNLYFSNPSFLLDVAKLISNERHPILVELVDKKYCIATAIVNHHIWPPYFSGDESTGKIQLIRNGLADYITHNLPENCYKAFFEVCQNPSETSLLSSMENLKAFFSSKYHEIGFAELTVMSIDETIDDYNVIKSQEGINEAVKKFIPIPDKMKNGSNVNLLPHVHSIFNLIARLNKHHLKEIGKLTLYHDNQRDFDDILIYSKELLENRNQEYSGPPVANSDFNLKNKLNLEFIDSKNSIGVQLADLLAGYFNRYINGLIYKKVSIDKIYDDIFWEFRKNFRPASPLGVNFVIPESNQQLVFRKFQL